MATNAPRKGRGKPSAPASEAGNQLALPGLDPNPSDIPSTPSAGAVAIPVQEAGTSLAAAPEPVPAASRVAQPPASRDVFSRAVEILRRDFRANPASDRFPGQPAIDSDLPLSSDQGTTPLGSPSSVPEFPALTQVTRPESVDLSTRPSASGVDEPEPPLAIPARMLNEFVYCPRLFYYEFVEGVFVENADTLRGDAIHERVDRGNGAMLPPKQPVDTPPSCALDAAAAATASGPDVVPARPEEPGEVLHSRSVQLGSGRLGVVAKLDLIEVRLAEGREGGGRTAASVVPVDYKAGAPRDSGDGTSLWPTDRMQLGLQILLLREHGYACDEGIIYYRATKQRVRLAMTPELELWIGRQIDAARAACRGPIPPPLEGSPKCVRCSLAPVCLPDETRLLSRLEAAPTENRPPTQPSRPPPPSPSEVEPRRLMAPRDDRRALYLNTPGLRVGRRDETLTVKDQDRVIDEVRLGDVHHVALFGNIQITTQAIQVLCDSEIPLTFFSGGGWFYGVTRGHGLKNVFLRIEQFRKSAQSGVALEIARRFVHGKIRNHRTMLMRNHVEPPPAALARLKQAAADVLEATDLGQLLGMEGAAAGCYFENFPGMLKPEDDDDEIPGAESPKPVRDPADAAMGFTFRNRNRRPPTDPVNAMLSLAYSLLCKDCTIALHAVGFDPYVGFYHQPRFGRPALALDLMEEFRPLIAESTVLSAVNTRVVNPRDFVRAGSAVNLTPAGRKKFFHLYEQRMSTLLTHPIFDYKISYRRALELQARILARVLTGELETYTPLLTR